MAPEIRFNAMGIPYVVEFANVSFRSRSQASTRSRSTLRSASSPSLAPDARPIPTPTPSFDSGVAGLHMGCERARGSQRSLLRAASLPFRRLPIPGRLRRKPSAASIASDWTLAPPSAASSQETLAAPPPPPKDAWLAGAPAFTSEPEELAYPYDREFDEKQEEGPDERVYED